MSEDRKFKPLVKLTGLYENQSKRSGETYFTGYLGAVKVVVLRNKNAEPGKPGWNLCVQEKDPKPDQGQGNTGYGQSQGYGQSPRQGYGQNQQPNAHRQAGYGQPSPSHQQDNSRDDDDVPF